MPIGQEEKANSNGVDDLPTLTLKNKLMGKGKLKRKLHGLEGHKRFDAQIQKGLLLYW